MPGLALLLLGLLAAEPRQGEYARLLDAAHLDQAAFDAETYGAKPALLREAGGLRMRLEPRAEETGWKTPPQLRFGGDFTITANLLIRKLPKPAQEDGAAVGLAIAHGDIKQPDLTIVRLKEPGGADVYRAIDRPRAQGGPRGEDEEAPFAMRFPGEGNPKPAKPPRRVFPAAGDEVRFELQREKDIVRFQVLDARTDRPRYLGQVQLGTNDIAAVKLFVTNRNGAEPLEVLWRDLTIRADRLHGLGTTVRTVFGSVVYGEPTALDNGILIVGGTPKGRPAAGSPHRAPAGAIEEADPAQPQASEEPAVPAPVAAPLAVAAPAAEVAPPPPPPAEAEPEPEPAPAPAPAAEPTPAAAGESDTDSVPAFAPLPTPPPILAFAPAHAGAPARAKPAEPKARIALGEVESIRFERAPVLAARFVGQLNVDLTRPAPAPAVKNDKNEAKGDPKNDPPRDDALAPPPGTTVTKVARVLPEKNGIRDVVIALSELRAAKIRQVTVTYPGAKDPSGWRLETSDSHDWPLVLRRAGEEPWAELYLEPPAADGFSRQYQISVVYQDGQNASTTVKAAAHTDAHKGLDPKEPTDPRPGAMVYLTGEERLHGTLEAIGAESLRLSSPWPNQAPLEIPLERVEGVQLSVPDRKETPESFARRLRSRGTEDLLLARTKDGEILALAGLVEGTEAGAGRLQFRYQERTRTLPLSVVEGWLLAARPAPKPAEGLRARVSLHGDLALSSVWKDLDAQTWTLVAPWGQELKVPAALVREVRFRGGAMTYLCDLEPSRVEETPFFGHRLPWRRDTGLTGGPLRMKEQSYEHGLAVHSRSSLTYELGGRYTRFEAVLGFDDAARGKGRVDCRIRADGKELFSRKDLRADMPPVTLRLPLEGAAQLQLEVDFGPDQDTGDRVIWANPRLYRHVGSSQAAGGGKP